MGWDACEFSSVKENEWTNVDIDKDPGHHWEGRIVNKSGSSESLLKWLTKVCESVPSVCFFPLIVKAWDSRKNRCVTIKALVKIEITKTEQFVCDFLLKCDKLSDAFSRCVWKQKVIYTIFPHDDDEKKCRKKGFVTLKPTFNTTCPLFLCLFSHSFLLKVWILSLKLMMSGVGRESSSSWRLYHNILLMLINIWLKEIKCSLRRSEWLRMWWK